MMNARIACSEQRFLMQAFASVSPALAAGSGGRAGGSAFSSARSSYSSGLSSGSSKGFGSAGSSSSMFGGSSMRGSPLLGGGVYSRLVLSISIFKPLNSYCHANDHAVFCYWLPCHQGPLCMRRIRQRLRVHNSLTQSNLSI